MSNFIPRLTPEGIYENKFWYSSNPFYQAGLGLPNCTCYAWGRFWEVLGTTAPPQLPTGNAGQWYHSAQVSGIYKTGRQPKLGSIICWDKSGGDGHVGIVEQINDDRTLVVSNSGYYRPIAPYPPDTPNYFYLSTTDRDYIEPWMDSSYSFLGFIYPNQDGLRDLPIPVLLYIAKQNELRRLGLI